MTAQQIIEWPRLHARKIATGLVLMVSSLGVNGYWSPRVDPALPPELAAASPPEITADAMAAEDSLDFIFRPLFLPNRRPFVTEPIEVKTSMPELSDQAVASVLEGYVLLGVFASGDSAGAIIAGEGAERQRVYLGDDLDGWVLSGTAPRVAHFQNASGEVASLELAIASSLPAPEVVRSRSPASSAGQRGDDISAPESASGKGSGSEPRKNDNPARQNGPVTFESIAARHKDEVRAKKSGKDKR